MGQARRFNLVPVEFALKTRRGYKTSDRLEPTAIHCPPMIQWDGTVRVEKTALNRRTAELRTHLVST